MQLRPDNPQSLKNLISGPFQEKVVDPSYSNCLIKVPTNSLLRAVKYFYNKGNNCKIRL